MRTKLWNEIFKMSKEAAEKAVKEHCDREHYIGSDRYIDRHLIPAGLWASREVSLKHIVMLLLEKLKIAVVYREGTKLESKEGPK